MGSVLNARPVNSGVMLNMRLKKKLVGKFFLIILLIIVSVGCEAGHRVYDFATGRSVRFPSQNMMPTIKPGDSGAVDQHYYSNNAIQRFDIVIMKHPQPNYNLERADAIIVERVIGLSGERIEIRGGKVYINGGELKEPFAVITDPAKDFGPFAIPEGEYFFLGDNRPNSFDSRYWDKPTVDKSYLQGKVVEIFPVDR